MGVGLLQQSWDSGFTVLELMVTMAILSILLAIAIPNFSSMQGQLKASEEIRKLASELATLRGEAVRQRTDVRVSFSSSGYSWDIGDDSTIDGSVTLNKGSSWQGTLPTDILFNGLGLARGLGASGLTLSVVNRGVAQSLTLNSNGHVSV